MTSIQQLYKSPDVFYKSFINTEEGKSALQEVVTEFPKLSRGGKAANDAVMFIYAKLSDWLYEHEQLNEIEIAAYLDSQEMTICSRIYKLLMK